MLYAANRSKINRRSPEPYPSIAQLGVVSDRRTAAVISADGTVRWLCLPNFDGRPVFGCLLDSALGGHWRLGPETSCIGRQFYLHDTNVLATSWHSTDGELQLIDAMLSPEHLRPAAAAGQRILLRRLVCWSGSARCVMDLAPRDDFAPGLATSCAKGGLELRVGARALHLWTSRRVEPAADRVCASISLKRGEEFWAILEMGDNPIAWTAERAREALEVTTRHWRELSGRYNYRGPRKDTVVRSALAVEMLSFAPTGALAAAATTSLPERIGGDRNYDYRYAWIRDASLAIATLSVLGDVESADRYLTWLAGLRSSTEMPLQVLYSVDGATDVEERTYAELDGYEQSRPVRYGNHAFGQRQIDCFGYLADCAAIYFRQGGRWAPEHWQLMRRIADYTVENWQKPSNGIWETDRQKHFVASKVMSWTTLNRALNLAERTGGNGDLRKWHATMAEIHAEVMERGWSRSLRSFRRDYDGDALDASALLIPLMGFLGPSHPRVIETVQRIEENLMIDGLVYRFRPEELSDGNSLPMGRFEGAFLPCCFWLATVYAMMGRRDAADGMLRRVEKLAGESGLFSEEADGASGLLLGNLPMIFSHAEYARAVLQLAAIWPRDV